MATYPVKWIHEGMRGAPQISGQPGTLLAAIRAFLITGFGVTTALSVTVADGIATAALQPGQSFTPYAVVLVEGATPAQLNGEARVLTASNSSVTWATDAPDGPATGTITIKVAPMGGWEELFPGTPNKGVFRSTDPQSPGFCWWIDDSGTQRARVRGYESMTDIDTGTGPFPTNAQINGGGYFHKSGVANSNAVPYKLAADGRFLIAALAPNAVIGSAYLAAPLMGFGDLLPKAPGGDTYATAIAVRGDTVGGTDGSFNYRRSNASAVYCARSLTGFGGAQAVECEAYVSSGSNVVSGADTKLGAFPSSVDGELKYCRRFVSTGANSYTPRAEIPGVLHVPQTGVASLIQDGDRLQGSGNMAGRMLLAISAHHSLDQGSTGISLLDITGPWR